MVLYTNHNFSRIHGFSDIDASTSQTENPSSIMDTQPFDGRTCQVHTAPEGGGVKLQSNGALTHMANVSDADKQTPLEKRKVSVLASLIDAIKRAFVYIKNKIFGPDKPANNDTRDDQLIDTSHDDAKRGSPEQLVANIVSNITYVSAEGQITLQNVREHPKTSDEAQALVDENDEQMWQQTHLSHGSANATASDINEPLTGDDGVFVSNGSANLEGAGESTLSEDVGINATASDIDEHSPDEDGASLSSESANLEGADENTLSGHVRIFEEEQKVIPSSRFILGQVKKTQHYIEYDAGDVKLDPERSAVQLYGELYYKLVSQLSAMNRYDLLQEEAHIKRSINNNKITFFITKDVVRTLVGDSLLNKMACAAKITLEATETRIKIDVDVVMPQRFAIKRRTVVDLVSDHLKQHISEALVVK